jgi:hypothetical protein
VSGPGSRRVGRGRVSPASRDAEGARRRFPLRALEGANGGRGLGPKFMAGRLFASSASPHRGPDSAVFSPKQRTPRLHIYSSASLCPAPPGRNGSDSRFESCGPAAGLPGPVRGPSSAGPPTDIRHRNARAAASCKAHLIAVRQVASIPLERARLRLQPAVDAGGEGARRRRGVSQSWSRTSPGRNRLAARCQLEAAPSPFPRSRTPAKCR